MAAPTGSHRIDRFLPHAVLATLLVVGLPIAVTLAWIVASNDPPGPLLAAAVALIVSVVVSVVGAALWRHHPSSRQIAFGELMLWGWVHRRTVERRLDRGTELLGLDRRGTPQREIRVDPPQQLQVLHELAGALESKDPYTHGHSRRVERHVYRTAMAMGLSVAEVETLRVAASLHDVGKIRVPDEILRKPGALSPVERQVMQEHALVGAWMVSNVVRPDVTEAIRHHHETWNGRGYPDHLAGPEIPLFARIIAVADAYDAITSTRPYRTGSSRDHALEIIKADAGKQFDPLVVKAFVESLPRVAAIAGVAVLLAWPAGLLRRLAMLLKHAAAGSTAPAALAVSAFVALGPVVPFHVAPSLPQVPPLRMPAAAAAPQQQASVPRYGHESLQRPAPKSTHPLESLKRTGVTAAAAPAGNAAVVDRGAPLSRQPAAVVATHPVTFPTGPSRTAPASPAGGRRPSPAPQPSNPPPPPPSPTPIPSPTPSQSPHPKGDPQPTKGRDCADQHPTVGEGNAKHCG